MLDRTSRDCAREIRGTELRLRAVTPAARIASTSVGSSSGAMRATIVAPARMRATSAMVGASTLTTTSLPHTASASPIVAPAAT